MSARVLQFATFCVACKEGLHTRCNQHLSELFGEGHAPCICGCYDDRGDLLNSALIDMMRRQPEALARHLSVVAAVGHGSLDCHLRVSSWKRSAP